MRLVHGGECGSVRNACVAQRYTTSTPHRYSYREAIALERVFLGSRTAEARSGDVVAERSTDVVRAEWRPESPPAASSPGGANPPAAPKVVPVITVVGSAEYPWSNYSRYRQEIVRKLERLEGELWDMVQEKAARDLTMDQLRAAYGRPLLDLIR